MPFLIDILPQPYSPARSTSWPRAFLAQSPLSQVEERYEERYDWPSTDKDWMVCYFSLTKCPAFSSQDTLLIFALVFTSTPPATLISRIHTLGDDQKPQCGNCTRKQLECHWGIKASFHPSRQFGLTVSEEQELSSIEKHRNAENIRPNVPIVSRIVDNTREITQWYQNQSTALSADGSESDGRGDDIISFTQMDSPVGNETQLLTALSTSSTLAQLHPLPNVSRDLIGVDSRSRHSSRSQDISGDEEEADPVQSITAAFTSSGPYTPPFSLGLALSHKSSPWREPQLPITEDEVLYLFRSFLAETATWCETTDTSKHFSVLCAHDVLENKIFKGSALALARRQLSMVGRGGRSTALQLYQYTIQLLIQQDPDEAGPSILASCTLLCVYEMMASDVLNWRRHLKVCLSLSEVSMSLSSRKTSDANRGDSGLYRILHS
ncbi:hypothetical protein TCE0_047f17859 [Talaromyces pinophilus]|uniref:Zn(2)-C6 fungal-type domain-containing protein n=1 Tax=Talaromyces pinophilus TaxID=128442 RepID=A0A0B8N4Z3_TALPI|nr:hypothetical protein TCE0_047f17859 [Talaromyces pinophilus]